MPIQRVKRCSSSYYRIQMRLCFTILVVTLILIFTSCSFPFSSAATTPTPISEPISTATLFSPGPSPAPSLLAPAPQHCPTSPPVAFKVFPKGWGGYMIDQKLTGSGPVWEDYITPNRPVHVEVGNHYTPWPGTKILWEVGPNYTQPVTIKVTNLRTGELSWWETGLGAPRTWVLDSDQQGYHGSPEPEWHEWGSGVLLLQAGCYAMDVGWPRSQRLACRALAHHFPCWSVVLKGRADILMKDLHLISRYN